MWQVNKPFFLGFAALRFMCFPSALNKYLINKLVQHADEVMQSFEKVALEQRRILKMKGSGP